MYDSISKRKMLEIIAKDDYASFREKQFARRVISYTPVSREYQQIKRELDAAIADIKELCMKHSYSMCHYCKYYSDDECEHTDCLTYNSMDAWQWRGVEVEE